MESKTSNTAKVLQLGAAVQNESEGILNGRKSASNPYLQAGVSGPLQAGSSMICILQDVSTLLC